MRVLLVTDAWYPQVNGVVRTLTQLRDRLNARGYETVILGPEGLTVGCPTYPEIRLTLQPTKYIERLLSEWPPHAIHIATEGPLGWAMRAVCQNRGWPFTSSFHTRFPEYIKTRFLVPRRWTYSVLKHFHGKAERVLVPTPSIAKELAAYGLTNTRIWGRGVDTDVFTPDAPVDLPYPRPYSLYVGRVAVEKNLPAFLSLDLPGTKLIVGDGPELAALKRRYPDVVFLGPKFGAELAATYAAADVFVFPSLTDTFGLVLLEALACGTPVAAFPAPGPIDVLTDARVATLSEDLRAAVERSLNLNRNACREFAMKHSWDECARMFADTLEPISFDLDVDRDSGEQPLKHAPTSLYYGLSRA